MFCNSIKTGNITVNVSGSNFGHKSCVEDELPSNCDTKESVDNATILIVTLRRRLMMKLILIVTLVWLG